MSVRCAMMGRLIDNPEHYLILVSGHYYYSHDGVWKSIITNSIHLLLLFMYI